MRETAALSVMSAGGVEMDVTAASLPTWHAGDASAEAWSIRLAEGLLISAAAFEGLGRSGGIAMEALRRFSSAAGRPSPVARRSTGSHKQNRRRALASR